MELIEPYEDINRTMLGLKRQVVDGIQYAVDNCPDFDNPEKLFYYLKRRTIYKRDDPNYEQIQSLDTLFDNNIHGISGAGDCDCFSTAFLTCCLVQDWSWNCHIVLAGHQKKYPVHIYNYLEDGERFEIADLTNPYYGMERPYKIKQILKFSL